MLFTGKIAAVVYIVAGDPAVQGDLLDLVMGLKDGAPAVILSLENSGRTHFRTKGTLRMFDAENKKTAMSFSPMMSFSPKAGKTSPVPCRTPSAPEPTEWSAPSISAG
jgi:hypothetical protein